ncbi:hypothetical protein BB561_006642 [Smittium simulii]|uniref:Uncharacterized protein n=1 Tax=Smittium simulii TaxID=133385 RepID=A0A2T9Y2Q1_9FUNG|nr:hypothetical protein BB561_006642 [Smittium simulii]
MGENTIRIIKNLTNKVFPTIEENFFCSPLTDKKRKEEFLVAPRVVRWSNYPTLANITRLIDLFVHQKSLYNPEILPEGDNIVFAHTIRILLSDLVTTISQLRMDTVHREMNLAGKPPQISEPETEPLFEPEAFNALVTAKNATRRTGTSNTPISNTVTMSLHRLNKLKTLPQLCRQTARRQTINIVFAGRIIVCKANKRTMGSKHCREGIQNSVQKSESEKAKVFAKKKSALVQNETSRKSKQSADKKNFCSITKKSNKGSENKKLWILQPTVCNTKENMRNQTSPQFEEAELTSREKKLQSGDIVNNISYQCRKDDMTLLNLKDALTHLMIHQLCKKYLKLSWNVKAYQFKEDKKNMYGIHIKHLEKSERVGVSDKLKEVSNHSSAENHAFRNSDKFKEYYFQSLNTQKQGLTPRSAKTNNNRKELKNRALSESDTWKSTVILSEPAIQNLMFWKIQLKTWNRQPFLEETPELNFLQIPAT